MRRFPVSLTSPRLPAATHPAYCEQTAQAAALFRELSRAQQDGVLAFMSYLALGNRGKLQ